MLLTIKAIIGALVVVVMALLSRSSNYYLVGLIPLFPTFALIGNYLVYQDNEVEALKKTALFGMLSLVPYLCYLVSVYFLSDKISNIYVLLMMSVIIWCLVAYVLLHVWKYIG